MSVIPAPGSSAPAPAPLAAADELDAASRWPVLFLLAKSLGWLSLGLALSLVAAVKLHAPGFLADCAWLTFGRVQPAAQAALTFGFAAQGGMALALWLTARLGRTPLAGGGFVMLGTAFWNLGVGVAVLGILGGWGSGVAGLEMPRAAVPLLLAGFALQALPAWLTLARRRERAIYVSLWFAVAAWLWVPPVLATATVLLGDSQLRGVPHAVAQQWSVGGLRHLWLGGLGLAALFYFIPKLADKPLPSRPLAVLGFWVWAAAGGWTVVAPGSPLPRWAGALSTVAAVFLLVPMLAAAWNWHGALRGAYGRLRTDLALRLVAVGAIGYVASVLFDLAQYWPGTSATLRFTYVTVAAQHNELFVFLGNVVLGGLVFVTPRLLGQAWPCAALLRLSSWLWLIGGLLTTLALTIAGGVQGHALNSPATAMVDVVRSTIPFMGLSTLGLLLLLAGSLLVQVGLYWMGVRRCAGPCRATLQAWRRPVGANLEAVP